MGDFLITPPVAAGGYRGFDRAVRANRGERSARSLEPRRGNGNGPARNPYLAAAEAAAANYERLRHLPSLVAMWPREMSDFSRSGTETIIAKLETALRLERKRGIARHWCYDLNRHAALISALKAEKAFLSGLPRDNVAKGGQT